MRSNDVVRVEGRRRHAWAAAARRRTPPTPPRPVIRMAAATTGRHGEGAHVGRPYGRHTCASVSIAVRCPPPRFACATPAPLVGGERGARVRAEPWAPGTSRRRSVVAAVEGAPAGYERALSAGTGSSGCQPQQRRTRRVGPRAQLARRDIGVPDSNFPRQSRLQLFTSALSLAVYEYSRPARAVARASAVPRRSRRRWASDRASRPKQKQKGRAHKPARNPGCVLHLACTHVACRRIGRRLATSSL